MTIPDLFERVAAKVPEVRNCGLKHNCRWWYLGNDCVSNAHAHLLIEAACWRMLPNYDWHTGANGKVSIFYEPEGGAEWIGVSAPTLTEALLLAVERVHGDKR